MMQDSWNAAVASPPELPPIPPKQTVPDAADAAASLRMLSGAFSAVELRDRVVIMLLFDQVVREDQVELAWQLWNQMSPDGAREPLWRVLTLFPDLDRELVYAEAARVYGFEEANLDRRVALFMIQKYAGLMPEAHWNALVELRVVPIDDAEETATRPARTIFATQDPTRPEVHRLLPLLDLPGYELRYAPEDALVNLLVEAFPRRYAYLKGLSGMSRDLLAGAAIDAIEVPPSPVVTDGPGSSLHVFEDTLVEAVRARATDVCFLPTADGRLEVYFQHGEALQRQRVLDEPRAKEFVRAIRRQVILDEQTLAPRVAKRAIRRWIDGARVGFRVAAVPPHEEVHAECIVVHVGS